MSQYATTVLRNSVTLTADAADVPSSAVDLSGDDKRGMTVFVELTNGATGPTDAAQVQPQVSPDNTNWYDYGGPLVGLVSNDGVASWAFPLPRGYGYYRSVAGSNTDEDVTVREEVTVVSNLYRGN